MLVQKKMFWWGQNDFSATLFRIIISNTEIEEELNVWIKHIVDSLLVGMWFLLFTVYLQRMTKPFENLYIFYT